MAVRLSERRKAQRRTVANRPTKGCRDLHARSVPTVWMEVDAKAAPFRGGEAGWQPDGQLWRAVAADQKVRTSGRADTERAVAPALGQEAEIADRPRPWYGADDREDGYINLWGPGDDWRVGCGGIWIGRER